MSFTDFIFTALTIYGMGLAVTFVAGALLLRVGLDLAREFPRLAYEEEGKIRSGRRMVRHCYAWPIMPFRAVASTLRDGDDFLAARDREIAARAYDDALRYLRNNPSPVRRND